MPGRHSAPGTSAVPAEAAAALRRIERHRRILGRSTPPRAAISEILIRFTCSSFRLENLSISQRDVIDALSCNPGQRRFRPRQLLRIRNHVAILQSIRKSARRGEELRLPAVVRWYTSISCGLSIAAVDLPRASRLEQYLRRIASPQLRVHRAVQEIAELHVQLLADPLFPGFNGILSRLLLQHHLSRCKLPLVTFEGEPAATPAAAASGLLPRLIQMIEASYELLLERPDTNLATG